MTNNVERFNETVENYLKYRPSYPPAMYHFLVQQCSLTKNSVIADIGSGTGFLAKLFLDNGHTVYGVEPNAAMRKAGEEYLSKYSCFYSVDGLAEATTLPDQSVDWVTAGTAFHWFNAEKTRTEFKRILKSPGFCLLVWNVRNLEDSALLQEYEELISKYGKDYRQSRAQRFNQTAVAEFFKPYQMETASFINSQQFNWEGLQGRLFSTSYSLRESDPEFKNMLTDLRKIFDQHQQNGLVEFPYNTQVYYGRMK